MLVRFQRLQHWKKHLLKWYPRHRESVHIAFLCTLAAVAAMITGQMFYPYGRILPGVSIDGRDVGGQTVNRVAAQLEKRYDAATLTIETDTGKHKVQLKHIGIEVVARPTAQYAAEYTVSERLVPFSFLSKMSHDIRPILRFDDERLAQFAAEVAAGNAIAPKDASITVENGQATLVPAKPGRSYKIAEIMRALHELKIAPEVKLRLKPGVDPPKRGDDAVRPTLTAAQDIINMKLQLKISNEAITVDKKTLAGWIGFSEENDGKNLKLTMREDAIKAYLGDLRTRINRAPGTTTITLVDGQTVARTEGMAGFGIDVDKSSKLITEQLPGASAALTLPLVNLPPVVVYNRSYTNSQAGLDAIVQDLASARGASLTVLELGGQGRRAEALGNKQWTSASMYKIYVAYALLKKIDAGEMQWSDGITFGKDAAACFEAMIVLSDNVCAHGLGDRIGWGTVESMVRAVGLHSTRVGGVNLTTANDLVLFLTKLEDGSLLPQHSRDKLLHAMRRQIYRSGIPTGTGSAVSNKVGYVGSVRHDAGIVYGSKGVYIVAIMTPGAAWPSIADTARQLHTFLIQ